MATRFGAAMFQGKTPLKNAIFNLQKRSFHLSPICCEVQSARVKVTPKKNKPVSYERAFKPIHIGHRKSWNSWNTSTIEGGLRTAETLTEDMFIRKFIEGTFVLCVLSDVIIKRQHNIIRLAFLISTKLSPERVCFLIGFSEELLSYWLQCIIKIELQVVYDPRSIIFKFV